jgi:DNA-binding transcriptional ArsR family regulator
MQTLPRISLDSIFTAIGHAKRRGIIESLSFRPATVSQLAEEHAISLPGIHKHIRILEDAQLIQRKKVGRTNFVAIQRSGLKEMQAWVRQFHPYWGNDRETLENYIEKFTS